MTKTRLAMTTVALTSRTKMAKKPASQVDRTVPVVIDPTARYRLTADSAQPRSGSPTSGRNLYQRLSYDCRLNDRPYGHVI